MSEPWRGDTEPGSPGEAVRDKPDHLWPRLIVGGLLVVMLVNFAYIWIAVSGADDVVPSYVEEER